jgi:hypothetical protein
MEENRDEEYQSFCAPPSKVRTDCTVITDDGFIIDLACCEHLSPDGDLCYPVMVYANRQNLGKCCPSCAALIGSNKPIFLMDNGQYCHPCTECEKWVWWVEDELWMYWLE